MRRFLIATLIFILICCVACTDSKVFPPALTKWKSEEVNMEFVVDTSGNQIGRMYIEGEEIQFFIVNTYSYMMNIYPIDYYYNKSVDGIGSQPFEEWSYTVKNGKRIATVKETTYFEIGQEIVFELVEENIDESEIPYPSKPETLLETSDYDFPYPEN